MLRSIDGDLFLILKNCACSGSWSMSDSCAQLINRQQFSDANSYACLRMRIAFKENSRMRIVSKQRHRRCRMKSLRTPKNDHCSANLSSVAVVVHCKVAYLLLVTKIIVTLSRVLTIFSVVQQSWFISYVCHHLPLQAVAARSNWSQKTTTKTFTWHKMTAVCFKLDSLFAERPIVSCVALSN